jgi:hypothetical protein
MKRSPEPCVICTTPTRGSLCASLNCECSVHVSCLARHVRLSLRDCSACGTRIASVVVAGPEACDVQMRFLGLDWCFPDMSEAQLAQALELDAAKMNLIVGGQRFEPGDFRRGFDVARTSHKPAMLVAPSRSELQQAQRIERAMSWQRGQEMISGFGLGVHGALRTLLWTVVMFFTSLLPWTPFPAQPPNLHD